MTLRELYDGIQGDYDQALRVLRVDKLIDKHIRKLEGGGAVQNLIDAGERFDTAQMFEYAHAVKGVCGNLGLVKLAEVASEITEEFRPEKPRFMSDEEVRQKIGELKELYQRTIDGIHRYTES